MFELDTETVARWVHGMPDEDLEALLRIVESESTERLATAYTREMLAK